MCFLRNDAAYMQTRSNLKRKKDSGNMLYIDLYFLQNWKIQDDLLGFIR